LQRAPLLHFAHQLQRPGDEFIFLRNWSAYSVYSVSHGTVLVTGGTGFLGRRIVERLLSQGRSVAILGRTPAPELEQRGVRFIRASLDDAAALRRACAGVETVFHTAAKVGVWGRYDDFFRANVLGTRALLEGCREHGVKRFIHTSTPSVVYHGGNLVNANESAPLTNRCPSPYPLTKALAEREVLAASSPDFQTIALRPHLIWGEGDPHLVPRILERARAGRLRRIGDGRNRVDMVHVENAVDAHLLAEAALSSSRKAS
jgi:nucleoside-diphosphate-sugar epimerase